MKCISFSTHRHFHIRLQHDHVTGG
uniref:Uncharacterized protein n=1 Tax=Anguilla anguilla TaxID=7936 RepID=A0A0E9S692_ANGAN